MTQDNTNKKVSRDSQLTGAILGGIVADAGTVPLHWIYYKNDGNETILNIIKDTKDFAFFKEQHCPFYRISKIGLNSCYGDEFRIALNSLEKNKEPNLSLLKENIYNYFGPDTSPYQVAAKQSGYPRKGPYLQGAMKDFCKKYIKDKNGDTASKHSDTDQLYCALPFCIYLNKLKKNDNFPSDKLTPIIEAISNDEDTNQVALFFCELIWNTLNGATNIQEIVSSIIKNKRYSNISGAVTGVLNDFKNNKYKNIIESSRGYGQSCNGKYQLVNVLYALLLFGNDYKSGVLEVIKSNGDTCGRIIIYGSIMASIYGKECIPQEWIDKTINAKATLDTWSKL